jgi:phospholipase/lecithinase/hemolysin
MEVEIGTSVSDKDCLISQIPAVLTVERHWWRKTLVVFEERLPRIRFRYLIFFTEVSPMKSTYCRKYPLISTVLVLLYLIPNCAAAQTTPGRIVVFGTSLSDPGNAFALWGTQHTPPYDMLDPLLLIPGASPYAKGGHHFSNGATWVEQFSRALGLARDTCAAFQSSSANASNYAVGAARAREGTEDISLTAEVSAFLQAFDGRAPLDGLYVIEMGSNDVRDAFAEYAAGKDGGPILQAALTAIGNNIATLYAAGARRFLIWNVPDIGLTPALRTLDKMVPGAAALGSSIASGFNSNLSFLLDSLAPLPGIEIVKINVFKVLHDIVDNPTAYGLSDVNSACVMRGMPPFECMEPDGHLFWDGIHPTKAVHSIVAQKVAVELAQQANP